MLYLHVCDFSVKYMALFLHTATVVYSFYSKKIWNLTKRSSAAQKMKLFIKDFCSKWDQIRRKLRIWPYLLKNPLWKTSFFVQCSGKGLNLQKQLLAHLDKKVILKNFAKYSGNARLGVPFLIKLEASRL